MFAEHPVDYVGKSVSVKSQVILGKGPLLVTKGNHRILISEPGSRGAGKASFDVIRDANWERLNDCRPPRVGLIASSTRP
jgi:hypothetical protein